MVNERPLVEIVKEIDELEIKATPGPWRTCGIDNFNLDYYSENIICLSDKAKTVIFSPDAVSNPFGTGNLTLIRALRNIWPWLSQEIKQLQIKSRLSGVGIDYLKERYDLLCRDNLILLKALNKIQSHGCCVLHNDSGCPGCTASYAIAEMEKLRGEK